MGFTDQKDKAGEVLFTIKFYNWILRDMNRKILLIGVFLMSVLTSVNSTNIGNASLNDWENQGVFGINKEYYHVNVVPYPDLKTSLTMDFTQSTYHKSLNGIWKIYYVTKPADAPKDFYKPEFSVAGWQDVKVP